MAETLLLRDVCNEIFTGLPPRLKGPSNSTELVSVPLVGIRAITSEGKLDTQRLEEFSHVASVPDSILPLLSGDVLMTIRGSAPKTAIVEHPFPVATFPSGNLAVLRPNTSRVDASYLWSFLSSVFRNDGHSLLTRATTQQLSIRISNLNKLEVPMPSIERQRAIGKAALALRDAVIAQQKAAAQCERTFEAFLSDTFSKL